MQGKVSGRLREALRGFTLRLRALKRQPSDGMAPRRLALHCSERGRIRLETLIDLNFINSSFSSISSYRSYYTSSFPSFDSSQQHLSRQYPPPPPPNCAGRHSTLGTLSIPPRSLLANPCAAQGGAIPPQYLHGPKNSTPPS